MSFNDAKGLQIVGSASIRSQQYAGDYDGYQVVEMSEPTAAAAGNRIAEEWKENIKRLQAMPDVYIGDIKCGEIPEWRIIPEAARLQDGKIVGYNPTQSLAKVDQLESAKIISPAEATEAHKLLQPGMDIGLFLQAKQTLKFHIIRWTPRELVSGRKKLRDGRIISLSQACRLPGMAKMDAIAKVQNSRFTDFSVIYEFRNKGRVLNPYHYDVRESLREAIVAFRQSGDSFKSLKRIYTLARYENDMATVKELTPILNSDLGRLYHIISDMRTLVELLNQPRVPIAEIRYEIDQFVGRLSNIYKLEDVLKNEGEIIGRLHSIVKLQKGKMAKALEQLAAQLEGYLQYATQHVLDSSTLKGGNRFWSYVKASIVPIIFGLAAGGTVGGIIRLALAAGPTSVSIPIASSFGGIVGLSVFLYKYIINLQDSGLLTADEAEAVPAALANIQEQLGEDPSGMSPPEDSDPSHVVIPVRDIPVRTRRTSAENPGPDAPPSEDPPLEHVAIDVAPGGAAASIKPKPKPKRIALPMTAVVTNPMTSLARKAVSAPGSIQPESDDTILTITNPLHKGRGKAQMKGGVTWKERLWSGIRAVAAAIAGGATVPVVMAFMGLRPDTPAAAGWAATGAVGAGVLQALIEYARRVRDPAQRATALRAIEIVQTSLPEMGRAIPRAPVSRAVAVQPPVEETRVTFNPMRAATRSTVASAIGTGKLRGGVPTAAESRYIAANSRLNRILKPFRELNAERESFRSIRDNPSASPTERRRAAAAMANMAEELAAYQAATQAEVQELLALLRTLPTPSLGR